ncbi:hypothetical protein JAAARDRAFT_74366 [Jaapia argillacea MUCL 33604]|uniref:Opi1-domain-containing protein n=1 Tax=Jaapia argillacea MUCL 33604 TaxID=933084 RepID=A0A067PGJ7_9AGAM|nr:hypothetical protein JAAARDRAFT_74366 [Jaapia argillacea MUCL 33604]
MDQVSLEDQDESVRIAVRALGDMRNGSQAAPRRPPPSFQNTSFQPTPALSIASTSPSPSLASPSLSDVSTSLNAPLDVGADVDVNSPDFIKRMSHLPIVNTAMRAYEQSKASSRVVKYGAEMMESSVKSISRPVIDRLPVNQLDEFACRQLDRLGRYAPSPAPSPVPSTSNYADQTIRKRRYSSSPSRSMSVDPSDRSLPPSLSSSSSSSSTFPSASTSSLPSSPPYSADGYRGRYPHRSPKQKERDLGMDGERDHSMGRSLTPASSRSPSVSVAYTDDDRRPQTPTPHDRERDRMMDWDGGTGKYLDDQNQQNAHEGKGKSREDEREGEQAETQVVPRSRWQAMLLEAGGLGAAVSEESMRRLRYCLQWLQYATAHIDAQILVLRDFIASLQPLPSSRSHAPMGDGNEVVVSSAHMRTLNDVKKDVVHTIRQVVDVVSKYAGSALPEPARTRVRGFILHLPQRWATAANRARHETPSTVNVPLPSTSRGSGSGRERERGAKPYSRETSRPASPVLGSPRVGRHHGVGVGHRREGSAEVVGNGIGQGGATAGTATAAAQRILTLATESLDMMRGVTGVVKDSLDRADAWVERLRVVGIQRVGQNDVDPTLPPGQGSMSGSQVHSPSEETSPSSSASNREPKENMRFLASLHPPTTLPPISTLMGNGNGSEGVPSPICSTVGELKALSLGVGSERGGKRRRVGGGEEGERERGEEMVVDS